MVKCCWRAKAPNTPSRRTADLGFALGGGQALYAHGLGERLSLDLDFYVTQFDEDLFDRAETAVLTAMRALNDRRAARDYLDLHRPARQTRLDTGPSVHSSAGQSATGPHCR